VLLNWTAVTVGAAACYSLTERHTGNHGGTQAGTARASDGHGAGCRRRAQFNLKLQLEVAAYQAELRPGMGGVVLTKGKCAGRVGSITENYYA